MAPGIEVIVGTYEEFLLGYKLDIKNEKKVLTQSFADKSHSGSLKCLAVQGRWVATGATDDRIFIYDMGTRKQSQIILSHEGTINALAFTPDETHLLSGGDDGRMIATRLNTWFTEATWKKAHSGSAVTHISCHPSGKMALSLGSDLVLRTWNLVKGRVAYKTNLKSRNTLGSLPDCLAWSMGGDYFTLSGQRVVEIWSIKTADVVRSQKTPAKPICICWIADETCLVGLEDGQILWITLKGDEEKEILIQAHESRVKTMCFHSGSLVTASSSGELKMWQVMESKKKLKEIASVNIGCRPTCIGILDLAQFGDDYVLSHAIAEQPQETVKPEKKTKQQERGVVTIEYESDENAEDGEDNEAGSAPEEESADEKAEEDDESEEVSDNEDAFSSTDGDDNDDDDDDEIANEEPQIRLPKSRKQKQQILNSQKQTQQTKFNEKNQKPKGKLQKKNIGGSQQKAGSNAAQTKPKKKKQKN